MAIQFEEPEIVIVKVEWSDGAAPTEIRFTRTEYSQIEHAARCAGQSVGQWMIDTFRHRATRPAINPLLASNRGIS